MWTRQEACHFTAKLLDPQVFLRMPPVAGESRKGKALVYAASWWRADQVNEYLRDKQLPIWASLSNARTELYRDVQLVCYGNSPFLARSVFCESKTVPPVSTLAHQSDRCTCSLLSCFLQKFCKDITLQVKSQWGICAGSLESLGHSGGGSTFFGTMTNRSHLFTRCFQRPCRDF